MSGMKLSQLVMILDRPRIFIHCREFDEQRFPYRRQGPIRTHRWNEFASTGKKNMLPGREDIELVENPV